MLTIWSILGKRKLTRNVEEQQGCRNWWGQGGIHSPRFLHQKKQNFGLILGFYRTWHWVRMFSKFSKSGLSRNQTFSFSDARLLKIETKIRFPFIFFLFTYTGSSRHMRISLLRFFKTITKIWLMQVFGLKILVLST